MELLTAFIGLLGSLNPVSALFALIAAAEAIYIARELRKENDTEQALRTTLQALNDNRVADLKEVLQNYDDSIKSIVKALNQLKK